MHFEIGRESLAGVVEQAAAVSDKRSSMEILSHLVIQAEKESLKITATDLESGFEGRVNLDKQAVSGAVAVEAKTLLGLLKNGAGEKVSAELNQENLRLKLKVGTATYHLPGLDADEFPALPDLGQGAEVAIQADQLLQPLGLVSPCMGNEGRYNLAGVRFEKLEDGQLRAVATDSHRLATADFELDLDLPEPVLVPSRGVTELLRMLKSGQEFRLAVSRNAFSLAADGARLIIRNLRAPYPDYAQVSTATEEKPGVTLNRPRLLDTLTRMGVMISDRYQGVSLAVNGGLEVSLNNPERGEVRETVELISNQAEESVSAFNLRYLQAMLRSMRSEEVTIAPVESGRPSRFTGPADTGFVGHIMAINI